MFLNTLTKKIEANENNNFFCSGTINLLFDGLAYNAIGHFAHRSYFSSPRRGSELYYATHKISTRMLNHPIRCMHYISRFWPKFWLTDKSTCIAGYKVAYNPPYFKSRQLAPYFVSDLGTEANGTMKKNKRNTSEAIPFSSKLNQWKHLQTCRNERLFSTIGKHSGYQYSMHQRTTIKDAESKPVLILAPYHTSLLLRNSTPLFRQVDHHTSIHQAKAEKLTDD